MRRAHVLPEYGVQQRLARTRVEHVEAIAVDHDGVFREVNVDHLANARITNGCRNVALLQPAKQHMNDDTVGVQALFGHPAKFFVSKMHRVARLKRNHRLPTTLADFVANFNRQF